MAKTKRKQRDAASGGRQDESSSPQQNTQKKPSKKAKEQAADDSSSSLMDFNDLSVEEQQVLVYLFQTIARFYGQDDLDSLDPRHFRQQFENLEKLIQHNLKEYPNLAFVKALNPYKVAGITDTFWSGASESTLFTALAVCSRDVDVQLQPHATMKQLLQLNNAEAHLEWTIMTSLSTDPDRSSGRELLIEESTRDILSVYHSSLIPWIEEHFPQKNKSTTTVFLPGDSVAVHCKLGEADCKGTIKAVNNENDQIQVEFYNDEVGWICTRRNFVRPIIQSSVKTRSNCKQHPKTIPTKVLNPTSSWKEAIISHVNDDEKEDDTKQDDTEYMFPPQQLPFISHEDICDGMKSYFVHLFDNIHRAFGPDYTEEQRFRNGHQLIRMFDHCFEDFPEIGQVVALDFRLWSLLAAVVENGGVQEASHDAIKYLIRKNPSALFWEIDTEREENVIVREMARHEGDEEENTVRRTVLECICKTSHELFFWVVEELPYVMDHPLSYFPRMVGTLISRYIRGRLPAQSFKPFFQQHPQLLDTFIVDPFGDSWDYPIQFCLLRLGTTQNWCTAQDGDFMDWMIDQHSKQQALLPEKYWYEQPNDSTLHYLCRIIGQSDNTFEARMRRTLPYWKFILKNNPRLVLNKNGEGQLAIILLRPMYRRVIVRMMAKLMDRTMKQLQLEEKINKEASDLLENSLLLNECVACDEDQQGHIKLLEDVNEIFDSWKDARIRELKAEESRCLKELHHDIDQLGD
jgi:hypothetical protein